MKSGIILLLLICGSSSAFAVEQVTAGPTKTSKDRHCFIGQKCEPLNAPDIPADKPVDKPADVPREKPDSKPGHAKHHRDWHKSKGFPIFAYPAPVYVQPVYSQINDSINKDEFVIDDMRIIFTNIWRGVCSQSECSVAAGYFASDPSTGIVLMSQPSLNPAPLLVATPTSTGPVIITEANMTTRTLNLRSQKGEFGFTDVKGNAILENGRQKIIATPGGQNYIFDIGKAKFSQ